MQAPVSIGTGIGSLAIAATCASFGGMLVSFSSEFLTGSDMIVSLSGVSSFCSTFESTTLSTLEVVTGATTGSVAGVVVFGVLTGTMEMDLGGEVELLIGTDAFAFEPIVAGGFGVICCGVGGFASCFLLSNIFRNSGIIQFGKYNCRYKCSQFCANELFLRLKLENH